MAGGVIDSAEVESADGTAIGFETTGSGPGLVVLPGALRAARHYRDLAAALADDFTVHTVDRRGRGASGPQGTGYDIDAECADLAAVLAHTGATMLFGHSYGGLVALESVLRGPAGIDRLAVYEPAISIDGGISGDWLPELAGAIADGRTADAVTSVIEGLELAGSLRNVPPRLRGILTMIAMRGELANDIEALLPTVHAEVGVVTALDSSGARYAGVGTDTLLMCGERGPEYLRGVVRFLHTALPAAELVTVPRATHNAPDMEAPRAVADQLRRHFGADRRNDR